MKKVLAGIVMATHFPGKAIKLFQEFEKAQAQVRKLTNSVQATARKLINSAQVRKLTNEEKMTDKIKVWKCHECNSDNACQVFIFDSDEQDKPLQCIYNSMVGPQANWQPTTQYQITPAGHWQQKGFPGILGDHYLCEVIETSGETDAKFTHIEKALKIPNYDFGKYQITERKPEPEHIPESLGANCLDYRDILNPPRQRVKIIWSEVTAENVGIAAALKKWCNDYTGIISNGTVAVAASSEYGPVNVSDIPKSWLEDIPAEPVSAEDIINEGVNNLSDFLSDEFYGYKSEVYNIIARVYTICEANNELRHAETVSFDDWWMENKHKFSLEDKEECWIVWQACKKSHNLK